MIKLFAGLALASIAAAIVDPADPCGTKQTDSTHNLTISTADDVKLVGTCTEIYGNLVIDLGFPGQVELPKLFKIEGDLVAGNLDAFASGDLAVESSDLTGLSFPSLVYVDHMHILGAGDLKTLDFPAIKTVQFELDLVDLPKLESWNGFETLNYSSYTYIINTGLETIIWNSSDSRDPVTGTIYISNNTNLELVNLYNPKNILNELVVNGNGNTNIGLGAETVRMLTVTGCSGYADYNYAFDGFSEIRNVTGLYTPDGWIRIWNNTFESISFDSLRRVNGSIEIHDNPNLVNVSMAFLYEIDGQLEITNNPSLKEIKSTDFTALDKIDGNLNITGPFDVVTFSPLLNVSYSFEIKAAGNISCSMYDFDFNLGYYAWGDPYSRYACAANGAPLVYKTQDDRGGSSSSGSSGKKVHGLSHAAFLAIVITIPVLFGLASWGGLIWWLCVRHKKKAGNSFNQQTMANVPQQYGPPPVPYHGAPPSGMPASHGIPATEMPAQAYQAYGNSAGLERKPVAVAGVNDQASSLTVGGQDRNGVLSTRSSISQDSRSPGELERREEELHERERVVEEMERERRAEELNAREQALAEREREIRAWDEQRKRNSGPLP